MKVILRVPYDQAEKEPSRVRTWEPDTEIYINTQITTYIQD